jgi:hypothetical protein
MQGDTSDSLFSNLGVQAEQKGPTISSITEPATKMPGMMKPPAFGFLSSS